jgi:simple sugar transport system substrate-binding protein
MFSTASLDVIDVAQGIAAAGLTGKVEFCGINFDESILLQIKTGPQSCAVFC